MRQSPYRGAPPPPAPSAARLLCLAVLALLAPLAGCGAGDGTVVFGVASPLETSYGASMRLGVELAQQEVNAGGGIRGRKLELRLRDDGADPRTAIAVADELYADPAVLAVVGHVNSGTMIAAAPVYARGLPAVATSATSPAVSRLGEWVFRVASSDSANAVELARLAHRSGRPTAVLYSNEGYGRGLAQSFEAALAAAGGEVLQADPYLETTADFSPYLERLKHRGAGLVFVAGLEDGAIRIIEQARGLGLQVRFLGGDGLEGLAGRGAPYDGTLVGLLFHPDASPAARAFADRFRTAYGREPDSFAALGYDATHLLARAAREGGPTRRRIRDHLASVGREGGSAPFTGVTGTVRLDDHGDPAGKAFAVGEIQGGRILLGGER
jgi:branched-chain amino acid transport system substrate-binding protein